MTTVTLIDGTEVDSASESWRLECAVRYQHVLNLRRLTLQQRRDYIDTVERKHGAEAARRLREAYTKDWQCRQAEVAAAIKAAEDDKP